MLQLGIYKGPRINKLLAETLRQLYIKLDDYHRKTSISKILITFLQSVNAKRKNKPDLKYSNEFLEALCFIVSQNSFSVGADGSSKILEYIRHHFEAFSKTLGITKPSLSELIFRLSCIELQNNVK